MKHSLFTLFLIGCVSAALAQSQADIKKAQEMMNDPQVQQQMRASMQQMNAAGVNTKGMDKMMDAAMGMNACMQEKVGAEGMDRMVKRSEELDAKVKALCAAGKPEEAEKAYKDYAVSMAQSKEGQAMRGCAEKYKDRMNDPSMAAMRKQIEGMNPDAKQPRACG